MNRRFAIGTLFFLFGLALLSVESGRAQVGPLHYTVPPVILQGFAAFAFVVSALYCLSLLVRIFKAALVSRLENYVASHIPRSLILPIITVYAVALFIVFTQGLIMGVARLPWDNIRLPLLVFGFIWIAIIVYSHIGRAYRLGKSRRQTQMSVSEKSTWLREIAYDEVKRRKPPVSSSERLRQFAVPRWKTIVFVVILLASSIVGSWILSHLVPGLQIIETRDTLRSFYLTMWQVQGAIAAVALPLLIAVIEFSKDPRQTATRRPEALIQETWVFPIIACALAGTARLGIDIAWFLEESVFWADFGLVFIGTICLTIFAYTRMLSILLSPLKMKKSSMAVIRSKMNAQLDTTIEQRVANNMLLRKLRELGLELWPFLPEPDEEEHYLVLRSSVLGTICDIDLGKLEIFVNRLPWKESRLPSLFGAEAELEKEKGKDFREQFSKQYIWWMRQYGKQITKQNNGLVRLDKSMFDIRSHKALETQLEQLIRVTQEDRGNELRLELSYIRDSLMDSIRDCKTGAVQEGLQMYEELITAFLDKLQQWESTYKKEQAIRESTSLEGGWFEIRWISDDLQEIIDMAMRIEYINVIREVLYFPIHLASLAFSRRDYYIFHQFLSWVPYYYIMALRLRDVTVKNFTIGRCSMYLAETLRYHVIPSIERSMTETEIEDGKDFARGIILIFNRLLKCAYDEKELEHFRAFLDTVHSVFESYFRHNQDYEIVSLELRLKDPALTGALRDSRQRQLSLKKKHVSSAKLLRETIEIMFFGLNAWVLHEYAEGKLTLDTFKKWDEVFPKPANLKGSWSAFSRAATNVDEEDYGWSFWESKEQSPSAAVAGVTTFRGRFDEHLQMLFCMRCLELIKRMDEQQLANAMIPPSSEIVSLAENENSSLKRILAQMEKERSKWTPIVGEDGLKMIPALRNALDRAIQVQEAANISFLKAAEISVERVETVKREIVDTWKNNAEFREIVQRYGDYEFIDRPPDGKVFFGFNQFQRKDIYVAGTDVAVEGCGSQFGRGLASWEDESFVAKVISSVEELDKMVADQDPVQIITEALDKLERAKYKPVIVILNSWSSFAVVEKSESFHKKENQSGQGLVGYFRNRPLFHLHYRGEPFIIIIDLKKFGLWRQFKPLQLFGEEEYISDELTFCVRPFTEKSAKNAVQQNPKLLLDKDGNERPEAQVISELQLQIHFRLLEQYELEIRDKASGYKVPTQL